MISLSETSVATIKFLVKRLKDQKDYIVGLATKTPERPEGVGKVLAALDEALMHVIEN